MGCQMSLEQVVEMHTNHDKECISEAGQVAGGYECKRTLQVEYTEHKQSQRDGKGLDHTKAL